MRIQLTIVLAFISFSCLAVDDKSMQELFKKYDSIMTQKKVELIEEVFSKKFIKESGGKDELMSKVKDLAPALLPPSSSMTWKKGIKGNVYFAKMKEVSTLKNKKETHESQFIVIQEDGKLKIDGTLSDDE